MEKGYTYRFYPNKTQESQTNVIFAAKRYVWNKFLSINQKRLNRNKSTLSYHKMSALLTCLKQKNKWLYESPKSVLQNTLKDLAEAFKEFFSKNRGFPKFKSVKFSEQSAKITFTNNNIEILEKPVEYTSTGKFKKQNCKLKLPGLKKVRIAYSRQIEGKILSATIRINSKGEYFVSVTCKDVETYVYPKTHKETGIDLGIKEFATLSTGEKVDNPTYYRQYERKLKKHRENYPNVKRAARIAKNNNKKLPVFTQKSQIHGKIFFIS